MMTRFSYVVYCTNPGCSQRAEYKIASRWSDGVTAELKTYGLVCAQCLPQAFRESIRKQAECRRAPKEILEPPGIYRLAPGKGDLELERLFDLEDQLRSSMNLTPTSLPTGQDRDEA